MQQETADELLGLQRHGFLLAIVAVILVAEGDLVVVDVEQPMVRDGHAMGIAADIVQHLLGPGEGAFGVHHPFRLAGRSEMAQQCLPLPQGFQRGKELQLSGVKGFEEIVEEKPAKQTRQDADGQKESGTAGDPLRAVRRQAPTGDHTVQVGMVL